MTDGNMACWEIELIKRRFPGEAICFACARPPAHISSRAQLRVSKRAKQPQGRCVSRAAFAKVPTHPLLGGPLLHLGTSFFDIFHRELSKAAASQITGAEKIHAQ